MDSLFWVSITDSSIVGFLSPIIDSPLTVVSRTMEHLLASMYCNGFVKKLSLRQSTKLSLTVSFAFFQRIRKMFKK
jgi:hypothetical protein